MRRTEDDQADGPAPLLATHGISKQYPGVLALDQVNFDLRLGEVHVLFGENGAGKSTLISILAGANQPSAGQIILRNERVKLGSVHEARAHGISAVFQEFSLIPQMTVEENLFLGAEPRRGAFVDKPAIRREARKILDELGFDLSPHQRVDRLTRAEQQMVEIAKAFRSDLSVLILDEPTASLTSHETDHLFELIGQLTARGVGIIYITHRVAEIRRIGNRITVLRDGCYIDTLDAQTASEDDLVGLMTGRVVGGIFPDLDLDLGAAGKTVLEVDAVSVADGLVEDATLSVRAGEIIGMAGLVGSGKSELMQACFGALPISSGTVRFKGNDITGLKPKRNIRAGFLYLPADRRSEGLMMMRPVRENVALASLDIQPFSNGVFIDGGGERKAVMAVAERLNLTPPLIERAVDHFSGGNQQKVLLARALTRHYDLIVFDEPTVGVDVGTRASIYRFIVELARAGTAIVVISSDLPEILHLTTRAYVFYRGCIQAEIAGDELTEENVLFHFFESEAA